MLPSFRLIAATFLCGFVVVFAGLRMAASLNDMHEGLPVMAAHAAPVAAVPIADYEMRRGQSTVPVMYDLRFAVSRAALAPTLVAATPLMETPATLDRPALSLAPPADFIREAPAPVAVEAALAEPERAVAAIQPEPPVIEPPVAAAPAVVPSIPETPKPEAPAVAAIDPQPAPLPEPAAAPTPEAVPANSAPAASIPEAKTAAIEPQATPEPEPTAVAAEPPASEPDITASIDATDNTSTDPDRDRSNPVLVMPPPRPKVAKAAPKKATAAVRKKRIARRAAPAGGASGANNPFSSPFGSLPQ